MRQGILLILLIFSIFVKAQVGPTGPQGEVGPCGPGGTNGRNGATGPTGATGMDGAQGIQGIAGPTGATGAAGVDGTQGIQGLMGSTGNDGAQGPMGATGPLIEGIEGQTLRHNGSSWISTSNLFNDGEKIGIGTTNPNETLDVNGNIYVHKKLIIGDGLFFSGNNSNESNDNIVKSTACKDLPTDIGFDDHDLRIQCRGNKTIINAGCGGNVGIGAWNPTEKLELEGCEIINQTVNNNWIKLFNKNNNTQWRFLNSPDPYNFGKGCLSISLYDYKKSNNPDYPDYHGVNLLNFWEEGTITIGTLKKRKIPFILDIVGTKNNSNLLRLERATEGVPYNLAPESNALEVYIGSKPSLPQPNQIKLDEGSISFISTNITRGDIAFIANTTNISPLIIKHSGEVYIGTDKPFINDNAKLQVNGKISATEVEVKNFTGKDIVFHDDYKLPSIEELEKYIKENKHLPGIPSAKETENGVKLSEMNSLLLQKVEELTLYVIKLNKEIDVLKKEK